MEKTLGQEGEKYSKLRNEIEGNLSMENLDFSRLYDETAIPLFHYLYSKVNNFEDAEDLTSQTFITAYENLSSLHNPKKFKAWLFTIARNKANDFFRKTKQHPIVVFDEESAMKEIRPEKFSQEDKDRLLDLANLIANLHPKEQEYLRLRIVAELPFTEIASILKKPESRIKKRYYRLLDRLQAQMES